MRACAGEHNGIIDGFDREDADYNHDVTKVVWQGKPSRSCIKLHIDLQLYIQSK